MWSHKSYTEKKLLLLSFSVCVCVFVCVHASYEKEHLITILIY